MKKAEECEPDWRPWEVEEALFWSRRATGYWAARTSRLWWQTVADLIQKLAPFFLFSPWGLACSASGNSRRCPQHCYSRQHARSQTSRKSSFPFSSPPRRMPSLGVPSSREVDSWRKSPGVTSAQGKVASWGTQGWVGGEEEKGGRSFSLLAMREAAGVEKRGRKLSRRQLPQGKEVSSEVWLPRALRDTPPPQYRLWPLSVWFIASHSECLW